MDAATVCWSWMRLWMDVSDFFLFYDNDVGVCWFFVISSTFTFSVNT
jgi:hypothetical protein